MLLKWDYDLFEMINGLAVDHTTLNVWMRFFAEYAEYFFYLAIVVYWFTRKQENRRMVAKALCSAVLAMGIGSLIGKLFYRNRPFVSHEVHQLIEHAANASFPSSHAIGAFVIATSIWLYRRKDGYVWLALAALIALSRIWTGVHYPIDVTVGALLGIGSAVAVYKLFTQWTLARRWLAVGLSVFEKIERKLGFKS
ncbi:undecaprenyl-diphosphatase [Paenibacillus sp. MZ04-78.2]|uniref:undecaprenyl-diphosphatase n=1 Tax=Paenibacillus sp. MZ04-78.2 TaxID=2962034 RepID=UPI0020B88517|nr:undecaprenyl-diphosphatase [Paenibacillus sp. MZ04-78.2]MCP3773855.1 undecaprenyl-diphosphatase [Paenibacillus sp. MZ04-78.2]